MDVAVGRWLLVAGCYPVAPHSSFVVRRGILAASYPRRYLAKSSPRSRVGLESHDRRNRSRTRRRLEGQNGRQLLNDGGEPADDANTAASVTASPSYNVTPSVRTVDFADRETRMRTEGRKNGDEVTLQMHRKHKHLFPYRNVGREKRRCVLVDRLSDWVTGRLLK